ncbi:MAG: hypothetical protein JWP81_5325 [Ferruginibacter sp.]|nr:hypothetical protein [Ferruginibacter sp.]
MKINSRKYKNKYRIPSARLKNWDYGSNAAYFVTICTKQRKHFFGEIVDEKMQLNALGEIAEREWIKSVALRPDMNLELGEFTVMPNHFHGIMIIGKNDYNMGYCRDAMHCVSTTATINQFGPQSKNLSSILRGYKSAVTTQANKMGHVNFAWQPRFYDIIIRNAESFERIQNYIFDNPSNWKGDKFYS